jgi:hypothetical protein
VKGRRKDDEAADKRGLSTRGSERTRERAADWWGRFAREREAGCGAGWRARGGRPEMGRGRRSAGAREGEAAGLGRYSVQQGRGGLFSFSFYFLIPISLFASFSFEQFIL